MAIAPIPFQNQQAFSSFDFSPLARLGQIGQQGQQNQMLANLGTAPADSTAPVSPTPNGNYARAISNIESGGKYDLVGPKTETGDQAYGKYQIMGNNIPQWTREVFGSPMTKEQFLASPEAQDAVFNSKFGSYVQKYGPAGAARAWFAGEGGMNNPNAKDILGTTVGGYERRFMGGLGVY
jgi:hypothetical protein